jgi:hypothetical protein
MVSASAEKRHFLDGYRRPPVVRDLNADDLRSIDALGAEFAQV